MTTAVLLAAVLACGPAAAGAGEAAPLDAALLTLRGEALDKWRAAVLAGPPASARRQMPFVEHLAAAGPLPRIEWDGSGRLGDTERALYIQEEDRILLAAGLQGEPPAVLAAVLAHELRHFFDRRAQGRWIGGGDAVSSDAELRAFEAQSLFWQSARDGAPARPPGEPGAPGAPGALSRELDARLEDMRSGFLRDFVEIHYAPTAAQHLAAVRRRLARLAQARPPANEREAEEDRLYAARLREEERLLLRDLDLQERGL